MHYLLFRVTLQCLKPVSYTHLDVDKRQARYYDDVLKNAMRRCILDEGKRLDGRKTDEIRPIWCEVSPLPMPHGSAIFTRGETQSLSTCTLGTKLDEKMVDDVLDKSYQRFLLHYNFPPFSTGEAKAQRGVGRREIGHGHLDVYKRQALDKDVFAALLKNYQDKVEAKYLPKFYQTIAKKFGGDCKRYVEYLYQKSFLMKSGKRIYANKKSYQRDPGVVYSLDLLEIMGQLSADKSQYEDSIALQEKYLCAAKLRMEEDMPHYSDANFTMRLSYGQVGGFLLGGKPSGYYTTAESMVEKMNRANEVYEYQAEPVMKEILSADNFGKYQDKHTGKMQLCFLTNNDITGGTVSYTHLDVYKRQQHTTSILQTLFC